MKHRLLSLATLSLILSTAAHSKNPENYTYAVVISQTAYGDTGWKVVADSLLKKHGKTDSRLFTWKNSVSEVSKGLSTFMPTYIGFVARPVSECNSAFIATVSKMARTLDNDPYGDAYWGVITGFEAADALRAISEPLEIKTVIQASGGINYEPPLQRYYQALGLPCESYTRTDYLFPNTNGRVYTAQNRPENQSDRVNLIVKWLNMPHLNFSPSDKGTISGTFDCLITGGHGNVNLWQMHYNDAGTEGFIVSSNGQLIGKPYSGGSLPINAPTPKVYWHVSNCLMGSPDNRNNWVYAAFHTGHAVQLFGFIPEASIGDEFMAWGMFDRTTKFAGTYTLPQSHFISNNNAQFELRHSTGLFNLTGVRRYMDSTLVYGDPAADVSFYSFGDSTRVYKETFTHATNAQGTTTFEYSVTAVAHAIEFGQGYCYQLRPVFFMPERIDPSTVSIISNEGSTVEITDNLILWEMLSPGKTLQKGATKTLSWKAKLLNQTFATHESRPNFSPEILNFVFSPAGLTITAANLPAGDVNVLIHDVSGRVVFTGYSVSKGTALHTITTRKSLASGVYTVSVKHSSGIIRTQCMYPAP